MKCPNRLLSSENKTVNNHKLNGVNVRHDLVFGIFSQIYTKTHTIYICCTYILCIACKIIKRFMNDGLYIQ